MPTIRFLLSWMKEGGKVMLRKVEVGALEAKVNFNCSQAVFRRVRVGTLNI